MRKAIAGSALLFMSGCISDTTVDGNRVFVYELWLPLGIAVLGLLAIPIGFFLRKMSNWGGWSLMICGPIAAIVFAPSLYRDRVELSNDRLSVRTGIWGLTAVHNVEFSDLRRIRVTAEEVRDKTSTRTNYFYNCDTTAGPIKVPVNNALMQAAAPAILDVVRKRGIPVQNDTGR